MYAKIENGAIVQYPYTLQQLGSDNPNVSFPVDLDNDTLARFNVVRVVVTGAPECDHTKTANETTPAFSQERNRWEQQWQIVDLSPEQIEANTQAEAAQVRAERDRRLSETDWRFRSDMNPSQEWKDYCQSLRDVPEQPGFPFDIAWPAKP